MAKQTVELVTAEEAMAARAKVDAYEAQQREAQMAEQAEAKAAYDAKMAPLRAIVGREEYSVIVTDLKALLLTYIDEVPIGVMVKSTPDLMAQLKEWAAK